MREGVREPKLNTILRQERGRHRVGIRVADPLPPDSYLFSQLVETGLVTVFFS